MSYKNTIYIGKTIDVLKDIYGKIHWCHIIIRYLREKPWMSAKNTISMGETIDAIEIYNISVKNHWCLIRYLLEKPLMSYTNTISMGKTSRCHIKIRYIWAKPLMTKKISMGKSIDVIEKYDIYEKNHRCHIKTRYLRENNWCPIIIRYLWAKPLMSYKITISLWKTIDVL